jgi:oligoribonuclease
MLGIFLDTEANGLDFKKHKIIEIAYKIIDLLTGEEKATYQSIVLISEDDFKKSNPKSLEINGFTYDKIKKGKSIKNIFNEIVSSFKKNNINNDTSVFICQNPACDRIFFEQIINQETQEILNLPYHWLDLASMFWSLTIHKNLLPWKIGFSKDTIATYYKLPPEEKPHQALNGVKHLLLCYEKVVGFPNIIK